MKYDRTAQRNARDMQTQLWEVAILPANRKHELGDATYIKRGKPVRLNRDWKSLLMSTTKR